MRNPIQRASLAVATVALLTLTFPSVGAAEKSQRYIVVFKDSVGYPANAAERHSENRDAEVSHVYRAALKGYAAELSRADAVAVAEDPTVAYIEPDGPGGIAAQTNPTGVKRIFASANRSLGINEVDDERADVDVAVFDTAVDAGHPDLDVVAQVNCHSASCVEEPSAGGGHGTHVAGTIGAIDNGFGVVGVAPGARVWSIRVLSSNGYGELSQFIAGIDWVTAGREDEDPDNDIDVANSSLRYWCCESSRAFEEAIEASVDAGVVHVVAAGNESEPVVYVPGNHPDVITVSALEDYDGEPGEGADSLAWFSNYGPLIDLAAPGVQILSTFPGNSYGSISGTSMASPHVAGAAAVLAAQDKPETAEDVEAIRDTVVEAGNSNWEDTSGDGIQEQLLDVSDKKTFFFGPPPAAPGASTGGVTYVGTGADSETVLNATVNPKGASTTYQFEYVSDADYDSEAENPYAAGAKVPGTPVGIGSGTADVEVSEEIEGLEPDTAYHFRVVAESSEGITQGEDRTFISLPQCKGIEEQCEWSLQPTPNPEPKAENDLRDVSCTSASFCLAVGYDDYPKKSFLESWDGTEWEIVHYEHGSTMSDVSCSMHELGPICTIVGTEDGEPHYWRWFDAFGGLILADEDLPLPEGAAYPAVNDVSCTALDACTAIGHHYKSGYKTLAWRYDGEVWAIQSTPNPSGEEGSNAQLLAASCATESECVAVGHKSKGGKQIPFAQRWNGGSWSILTTPGAPGEAEGSLEELSCAASGDCMATGYFHDAQAEQNTAMAASWDGSEWTVEATPVPGGAEGTTELLGVSCPSASSCIAVGSYVAATEEKWGLQIPSEIDTLAQSWDGEEWSIHSTPNSEGKKINYLKGISCISPVACTAVGNSLQELLSGESTTLGIRYDSEDWSLQSTPNPKPKTENNLRDVSCASSTYCLAVGHDNYSQKSFLEAWDGSEWEIVHSEQGATMSDVSCSTHEVAPICMIVGTDEGAPHYWRWLGIGIMVGDEDLLLPEGASFPAVNDVSCTAWNACTAVGRYHQSGNKTLAWRYDGEAWAIQSTPNPSGEEGSNAVLFGVSCASESECVAVGHKSKGGKRIPFAQRWNGGSWSILTTPGAPGEAESRLEELSCTTSGDCMAIGYFHDTEAEQDTAMAASWDGSEWTVEATPVPGGAKGTTELLGVSCSSASSCVAIGSYVSAIEELWGLQIPSEIDTLAHSWDGDEWSVQSTPNPEGLEINYLKGISCASPVTCTAVGNSAPELFASGESVTLGVGYG